VKTEEQICPYCGKPTGKLEVCTNCGADLGKRTTLKIALVIGCMIFAVGASFIWQIITIKVLPEVPKVTLTAIGEINEGYDYAYVWIEGTVSGGPRYRAPPNVRLDFSVDDGTGKIDVRVYSEQAQKIVDENKMPAVGDVVKLFGRARVDPQRGRWITLDSAEKFELKRPEPMLKTIHEVVRDFPETLYERVIIENVVVINLRPLASADVYTLRDEVTGHEISMYVHRGLENLAEEIPPIKKLMSRLTVTAGVGEWDEKPQLVLNSFKDIENLGRNPLPSLIPLENIDEHVDNLVGIQGKIVFAELTHIKTKEDEIYRIYKLWLNNFNEDTVEVRIWGSTYDLIPKENRDQLRRGTVLKLYGKVSTEYGLHVELAGPPEVWILDNNERDIYEPPTFVDNLLTITLENAGEFVVIQEEVLEVEKRLDEYPEHVKLKIGPEGSPNVLVWGQIWGRIDEKAKPKTGDTVRVVGKIIEYRGDIYVQPGMPADVRVVS
jgi:hypothetical protein